MTSVLVAMRVFVLEDNPGRLDFFRKLFPGCVTAINYPEAVAALEGTRFDLVYLDHDIPGSENGADVAFWMTRMPREKWPDKVIVHSSNVRGSLAIFFTLRRAGFAVEQQMYPPDAPVV